MSSNTFKKRIFPLRDKLFRLAYGITGSKQDAEDVVQDVLLNIWRKQDEWDKVTDWEAYCLRSTRNKALDRIALKDNQQLPIPDYFDLAENRRNAQEVLEAEEQLSLLERLIDSLPEKQRTLFRLREVEEMSYKEIATVMNVTEEQVKITLFRTRQKIKDLLDKYRDE